MQLADRKVPQGGDETSDDSDADLLSPGLARMVGMRTPRTRAAAARRAVQDSLALLEVQDKVTMMVSSMQPSWHMLLHRVDHTHVPKPLISFGPSPVQHPGADW